MIQRSTFPGKDVIKHHHPHELWRSLFQHVTLKTGLICGSDALYAMENDTDKIWEWSFYRPSWLMKGKTLVPILKKVACCCYRGWDWRTARAVTAFTHCEKGDREKQFAEKKECEAFLLETRFGWDYLGRFLDISDFRSCLYKKKAQILPELLDPFHPITATPCIHIVTSESPILNFYRRTNLKSSHGSSQIQSNQSRVPIHGKLQDVLQRWEGFGNSTGLQSFRTFAQVVWMIWTTGPSWP